MHLNLCTYFNELNYIENSFEKQFSHFQWESFNKEQNLKSKWSSTSTTIIV